VKSIAEILSSLSQPSQPLGASQGVKPVSSNSDQSKSGSFADVVKQLNSQPANNGSTVSSGTPDNSNQNSNAVQTNGGESTPGSSVSQVTAFDAINVQFKETIREGSSTNQNQVQQSLAGLASAFQQMVGFLLSNPGVSADQVQNQIVSATQGAITPDAAKALVAAVQGFLQSLPPSQKSLLADESTRQNLFNQLFQGLAAGVTGAGTTNKSDSGSDGSTVSESFNLQMAFGTSSLIQNANEGQSGQTAQTGSQLFAAGVSMDEFNDNQLQASITNSVLEAAPLSASLSDLTQQEGQLLTNQASGQNTQGSSPSPLTGQDLANLLNQAQAGEVNLTSFNQNKSALSSDQLNKIANIDFNQIFNSLTQSNQNAAAEIPPVTQADTLQAPTPGLPSVLGGSDSATIETSILSMPTVVTLQNLVPRALAQGTFPNVQQAGLVNRIFQEISASFNAPALTAPAPASLTPASVTSAATLGSGNQNQAVGSGLTNEASSQTALDAAPQILNSTPASGNSDQTQDTQTFQNFLRSSVVFDAEKFTFSVDEVKAPNTTANSVPAAAGTTVNNQVPVTQGALIPANSAQSGSQPALGTIPAQTTVVPLALSTIAQPAAGTTVNQTVSAASMFTNSVIAAQTIRPVAAAGLETENLQNNNQALPTDPNVSAVQSINPILAQGVNSVTTVAEFAAIKDQTKTQDPLSVVDNSSQAAADSAALAGSGSFSQVVQANSQTQNAPINAAGIIQQFAEQISQHTSQNHTISRLSFQLVPENLGKVTIQVALVDQSVSARIIVNNQDVKDGLQNHMVDLKAALSQAGLQIDQLQVQIQGGSSNLLGQYYQYQQEGSSYRFPVGFTGSPSSAENDENAGLLGAFSQRNTLVNLLA
jgi:flagellar hook-length control protein FliK